MLVLKGTRYKRGEKPLTSQRLDYRKKDRPNSHFGAIKATLGSLELLNVSKALTI